MTSAEIPSLDTLPARYPLIYRAFKHSRRYPRHPIAHRGFECGNGWFELVDELSAMLEEEARLLKIAGRRMPIVVQVKEKFGALRFYARRLPRNQLVDQLDAKIAEAEAKSTMVCEVCGQPGTLRGGGYIQTRCDQHAPKSRT